MARKPLTLDDPRRSFIKTIEELSHTRRTWQVFRDFCELGAISLANACAFGSLRDQREERFCQLIGTYKPEERQRFPFLLSCVVECMEAESFDDVLGSIFMEMDLGSHWRGQFFTPYCIAAMMTRMTFEPDRMEGQEFVRVDEPAAGAGGMIIAFAEAMLAAGVNPQRRMYAVATDVDPMCVHMSMIQFSLLGLPALVIEGNTLSGEYVAQWRTPAYMLGLWDHKIRRQEREDRERGALPAAPIELMPVGVVPSIQQLALLGDDDELPNPGKPMSENVDAKRRRVERARDERAESQTDLFAEET